MLHPKGGVRGFFGGGTHPRQRFLLMEGTLRLQGRLTGAVGEEGASYGGTTGVLGGGGGTQRLPTPQPAVWVVVGSPQPFTTPPPQAVVSISTASGPAQTPQHNNTPHTAITQPPGTPTTVTPHTAPNSHHMAHTTSIPHVPTLSSIYNHHSPHNHPTLHTQPRRPQMPAARSPHNRCTPYNRCTPQTQPPDPTHTQLSRHNPAHIPHCISPSITIARHRAPYNHHTPHHPYRRCPTTVLRAPRGPPAPLAL